MLALLCIYPDASPLTPLPMLLIEVSELSPHSAVLNFLTGSLAGHNYLAVLDLFHPHSSFCEVKAYCIIIIIRPVQCMNVITVQTLGNVRITLETCKSLGSESISEYGSQGPS